MINLLRWFVGRILVGLDALFSPRGVKRSEEEQARIDKITSSWSLYQFEGCPFCIKVRREMKRLSLKVELKDLKKDKAWEDELVSKGGKRKVPCLKIQNQNGQDEWLYESSEIITFFQQKLA